MKRYFNRIKAAICALAILTVWAGCTKYENPPAVYEDLEKGGDGTVKRKVLFISIDGAVGQEIKKNLPKNLTNLLKTSKYTFNALADENTSDASTWMSMMSGVSFANHGIIDDSYIPKLNENNPHQTVSSYPSILYRMSTIAPNKKTAVVSRSVAINDRLLVSANETYETKSDEAVKTKVVELLNKKNNDLTIVQFTDLLEAGKNGGFNIENAGYVSALNKIDGYIGEITSALEKRTNFLLEDWLIIITSNHGGIDKSYGGNSVAERNTFAIFENKNFKSAELNGERMSSVRMWGYDGTGVYPLGVRALSENISDKSDYDLATTNELTIFSKFRFNRNNTKIPSTYDFGSYNYWYSGIFGKDSNTSTGTPGWMFYTSGNDIQVRVSDGSSVATCQVGKINGDWYTMTAVLKSISPNKLNIKIYNNGTLAQESTTENMKIENIKTSDPLIFGYRPSISYDLVDFDVADVHILNKALSQEEIRDFVCYKDDLRSSAYGANLKGFWKMSPNAAGVVPNEISGKSAMQLTGPYRGKNTTKISPCDFGKNFYFIQSTDYYTQIFYWLELQTQKEWNLDGQTFLNNYEVEFLKP